MEGKLTKKIGKNIFIDICHPPTKTRQKTFSKVAFPVVQSWWQSVLTTGIRNCFAICRFQWAVGKGSVQISFTFPDTSFLSKRKKRGCDDLPIRMDHQTRRHEKQKQRPPEHAEKTGANFAIWIGISKHTIGNATPLLPPLHAARACCFLRVFCSFRSGCSAY